MNKNTWRYRIGTYMFDYKKQFPNNPAYHDNQPERYFCVITAYYTDGVMDSYGLNKQNILDGLESPESLHWTLMKMLRAFEEPIIDLDNFPENWQDSDNDNVDKKLSEFIKNQEDLDPEFNDILNNHLMDMIESNKEPKKKRF